MAALRKKKPSVNLLPQEEFAASTAGRVLTWILSTFRIIVIITELIVVAAFVSRFWLDAKISNLNDELTQRQSIIKSFSDLEKNFKLAQKKLKFFSEITKEDNKFFPVLSSSVSLLPPEVTLIKWNLDKGVLKITATSFSEQSILQFVSNLEHSGKFENVSVDQIDIKADKPGVNFTISASLKKEK